MKVIVIILGVVVGLLAIGWAGLQVKPKPFPAFPQTGGKLETMPLRQGLPAPVERYYRMIYGDHVPVVTSAVITGRAKLRPFANVVMPARFRFTHTAGQDYRHYIEAPWFGLPIMRVTARYLDGKGFMDLGFTTDEGPKLNQAANIGLWAETIWLPSLYVTDPRVRWEPVDDATAILIVPFEEQEDRFIARFDPETGQLVMLEAMRYRDSNSPAKILWLAENASWGVFNGYTLSNVGEITWFDQGTPWAVFTVEDIRYNVDVSEYVRQRGL